MIPMEKERFTVFPGSNREDPAKFAKHYNANLKHVGIVVLKPFGWEGRWTVPGEELSVTVGDSRDLLFRKKARLA